MTERLCGMYGQMGQPKRQTRKLKIPEALKLLVDEEAAKLVNEEEIRTQTLHMLEQNGIEFIDEIDKVTSRAEGSGAEVSRQGVKRDLLPLVEAPRCRPNTAWSRPITSCSSPQVRFT